MAPLWLAPDDAEMKSLPQPLVERCHIPALNRPSSLRYWHLVRQKMFPDIKFFYVSQTGVKNLYIFTLLFSPVSPARQP